MSTFLNQRTIYGQNAEERDASKFGDDIKKARRKRLKIMLQNINGLGSEGKSEKSRRVADLHTKYEVDILLMTEVGLNWRKIEPTDFWNERVDNKYDTHRNVFAYNKNENQTFGKYQPGGVGISTVSEIANRVIEQGVDETLLGRWAWTRLQGRNGRTVRIISVYRPVFSQGPRTTYEQQNRYFSSKNRQGNPRELLLSDLSKEIKKWQELNDILVIGGDFNQDVRDSEFENWKIELGLKDPILERHGPSNCPATCASNSHRVPIDAILISESINIESGGFLGFDEGARSDHRALWIELSFEEILNYSSPPLHCKGRRRLNTRDPRLVDAYCKKVENRLRQTRIPAKLFEIEAKARLYGWTNQLEVEYNILHQQNKEIRTAVEKKIRKLKSGGIPWSPRLQKYRDRIELWRMVNKKRKNRTTSTTMIRRLMKKTGCMNALNLSIEHIESELNLAFKEYKEMKKHAEMWRADYLEELAQSIANEKGTKASSEYKIIKRIQKQKRQSKTIKRIRGKFQELSVSCIEVQTHNGTAEITGQKQIEKAFVKENIKKFSQTMNSPPVSEPLLSILGDMGMNQECNKILNGTFRQQFPDERTKKLIGQLYKCNELVETENISTEEHIKGWQNAKEGTSSEPTTLSFSHYKAACSNRLIAETDATFRSLPYEFGFSPKLWQRITDVQILKKAGISRIDKMRTIMLMDGEFNMNNKFLGKVMMERAEDNRGLADEQYGSRKKRSSIVAALNKRLSYDVLRQKRMTGAVCSNDAKSCYDRIVRSIASLSMQRLGAPKNAIKSMLTTLKIARHHIKTAYGILKTSYGPDDNEFLQGIGQGNGCGPAIWAAISSPLLKFMNEQGWGAKFKSPISKNNMNLVGFAFVDDTDLIHTDAEVTSRSSETAQQVRKAMEDWEFAIQFTGGALVPEKCFWTMVEFEWKQSKWRYKKKSETEGIITLQSHNSNERIAIEKIEPKTARETLGVWLAADGNHKEQVIQLRKKSNKFAQQFRQYSVTAENADYAIRSTLLRSILYVTLATSLNKKQWTYIMAPALSTLLPRMGFVRTLPRVLAYGTKMRGGLNLIDPWHHQGLTQIRMIIQCLHGNNTIERNLILTSLEQLATEAGIAYNTKHWNYNHLVQYCTPCWLLNVWGYLKQVKGILHIKLSEEENERENDGYIMEEICRKVDKETLRIVNEARMILGIRKISDMATADGKKIRKFVFNRRSRGSKEGRSRPAPLTATQWTKWERTIKEVFVETGNRHNVLRQPVGKWNRKPKTF